MLPTFSSDEDDPKYAGRGRCSYGYADGRRCSMIVSGDDMGLCYYHAQRYINMLKHFAAGHKASRFLKSGVNTACDLSAAFSQLFCSTAQGHINPKTAAALAQIGKLVLQAHVLAKEEFTSTFEDSWPELVQRSHIFNPATEDPTDKLHTIGPDPYADKFPDESEADNSTKAPERGKVRLPQPQYEDKIPVSFNSKSTPKTPLKPTDVM